MICILYYISDFQFLFLTLIVFFVKNYLKFKNHCYTNIIFQLKILCLIFIQTININFSKTLGRCPKPYELLKKFNQNFYQNAITLRFSEQSYKLCH